MLLRSHLPDLYLNASLPFIERVIQEEYESYKPVSEMIFNVADMKNGIVQHAQVSSLSAPMPVGEAEEIYQDTIRSGFPTTYTAQKYALILATSQEAIDDSKIEVISKNPKRMARAFATAQEVSAASVFNDGFTKLGGDGKPLFATDHPLLVPGAGTSSNRLAVDSDLSQTSLQDMQLLFNKQLDTAGNRIMQKSRYLVVPPELEFLAFELVKSIMKPETSNNNVNTMGPNGLYNLDVVSWQYLTDPDAFFLVGEDSELYWFWAKRPALATEMEFKTEVALTKMSARWAVGFSDWRGVVGTPGA